MPSRFLSLRLSGYLSRWPARLAAATLIVFGAALAVPFLARAGSNAIVNCRRTLLTEGLRYCRTVRQGLVRCTHRNLTAPAPVDCINDAAAREKDVKAEIRARKRIRQSCALLEVSRLGFPDDLCPNATDLTGIESCLWETPVGWPDGSSIPGTLRHLCLSAASRLDAWIQQPGGYPEGVPTAKKCRSILLKAGLNFLDTSTKTLSKCEKTNIGGPVRLDCLFYPPVLSAELRAQERTVDKVETDCAHTTPEQLGYPTAECNRGGQAPPDIAAVVDCLWNTATGGGIAGFLRRGGYATVHALIPPACGNGVVETFNLTTRAEQCDDGNPAGNDCCDATCQRLPAASPCDDLDFCTSADQCDGSGVCVGVAGGCSRGF